MKIQHFSILSVLLVGTQTRLVFSNDIRNSRPSTWQERAVARRRQVAQLSLILIDAKLLQEKEQTDESTMFKAIEQLGYFGVIESAPFLVERLDYEAVNYRPSISVDPHANFPAVRALTRIGKPVIPFVVKVISEPRKKTFVSNGVSVLYYVVQPTRGSSIPNLLYQYATEYTQQSVRLRELATMFPAAKTATANAAPEAPIPPTEEQQIERLAHIFELEATLQDEMLKPEDEAKVVAAVEELGKLNAARSVALLADKLDWQWQPPKPDPDGLDVVYPMTAQPKGLRSQKIAEAARAALLQIGKDALPPLMDAAAMRGRSMTFYKAVPSLFAELAGGTDAARDALKNAAVADEAKTQRLREIAKSIPKVN